MIAKAYECGYPAEPAVQYLTFLHKMKQIAEGLVAQKVIFDELGTAFTATGELRNGDDWKRTRLNLAAGQYSLLQLCVLGFGLFKDRNVGVGILP